MNQLLQILLTNVIGPEIVALFAAHAAAGQPPPTSEQVIAVFNQHVDTKVTEGLAFLLSKEPPAVKI